MYQPKLGTGSLDLVWLELDLYDPAGLSLIRRSARTPIASCESLYGGRQFRPYFEQQSVDFAIIDVAWNGVLESMKIAAMADAHEVNVAPHNFNGHLGSLINAQMCDVVPNFKVMEIDIDHVTWKDDIVTNPPVIENSRLGRRRQRAIRPRPPAAAMMTRVGLLMTRLGFLFPFAALPFFGIALTIAEASSYSSCVNADAQGLTAPQGHGSARKGHCAHQAYIATTETEKGTIAQLGPAGSRSSTRPVPLSEIEREATISVPRGVTLDFSDGGANNVTVKTSDNAGAVQVMSKTDAVTVAPGTAHLTVANFGRCPKPTGLEVVSCDPIPVYSVTVNVQQ